MVLMQYEDLKPDPLRELQKIEARISVNDLHCSPQASLQNRRFLKVMRLPATRRFAVMR